MGIIVTGVRYLRNNKRLNVPTVDDVATIIESGFLAHCFEDLQHAEALSTPEVVRFESCRRWAIVKCG
jgi:hypothetical protein